MKVTRKICPIGNSIGHTIPTDWLKYLDLKIGDEVELEDKKDETGEYITVRKCEGVSNGNSETTE